MKVTTKLLSVISALRLTFIRSEFGLEKLLYILENTFSRNKFMIYKTGFSKKHQNTKFANFNFLPFLCPSHGWDLLESYCIEEYVLCAVIC